MEYELNGLLSALHLVDYISAHIRFDLERYLLNIAHLLYTDLHINGNRFLAILYYIICITFYYIIYRTLTILVFGFYCLTKISIRAKRSISRVFSLFIVPSPFFVHCPYKGRINRAESVLTGLKPY